MNKIILQAYDPEQFRETGKAIVDLLADYLSMASQGKEMPVLPWVDPEKQLEKQFQNLHSEKSFQQLIMEVIQQSNHLHHPRYAGHQVSAPLPITAISEFIGTFLNNASAIYEMGPVSVAMERVVMREMATVLGFDHNSDGFFTSGGTLGNLTALLAARQAMAPYDVWNEGMDQAKQLAFMVPADAHYSVVRGLRIAGFGKDGILQIPSAINRKTDIRSLEEIYREASSHGKQIIGLSANACSTAAGTYDELEAMADFCENHKIWFHVDGAHGIPAIFSNKHRNRLKGVERAHSVVIDYHKMMNAPALLTLVLFRDSVHSFETFSQNASYLFEKADTAEWFNYSKRTMECTKRMMGLSVFTLWKYYGPHFFSAFVDHTYQLAKDFAALVLKNENFHLAVEPESNIVCFRFEKSGLEKNEQNVLNKRIRKHITEEGSFYIVQTDIEGFTWLRVTLMNPFTTLDDLQKLLDRVAQLAISLE